MRVHSQPWGIFKACYLIICIYSRLCESTHVGSTSYHGLWFDMTVSGTATMAFFPVCNLRLNTTLMIKKDDWVLGDRLLGAVKDSFTVSQAASIITQQRNGSEQRPIFVSHLLIFFASPSPPAPPVPTWGQIYGADLTPHARFLVWLSIRRQKYRQTIVFLRVRVETCGCGCATILFLEVV